MTRSAARWCFPTASACAANFCAGITPIHLFTAYVGVALPYAVFNARRGHITARRTTMRGIYIGGCLVAGLFTLLPNRFLGSLLWPQLAALTA